MGSPTVSDLSPLPVALRSISVYMSPASILAPSISPSSSPSASPSPSFHSHQRLPISSRHLFAPFSVFSCIYNCLISVSRRSVNEAVLLLASRSRWSAPAMQRYPAQAPSPPEACCVYFPCCHQANALLHQSRLSVQGRTTLASLKRTPSS